MHFTTVRPSDSDDCMRWNLYLGMQDRLSYKMLAQSLVHYQLKQDFLFWHSSGLLSNRLLP